MIEWKWSKDQKSVVIAGNKFEILRGTLKELGEFFGSYEEAKWIYARLHVADAAFQDGTAEYENAVERLKMLRKEMRKSSRLLLEAAEGINVFFNPPIVSKIFEKGDEAGESFPLFVRDALKHLGPVSVDAPPDPTKKEGVGDRKTTDPKPSPVDAKTDPKEKSGDLEATDPKAPLPVPPAKATDPKTKPEKEPAPVKK